ncbi:MAG: hypothetical protein ACRYFZ_10260 [Janthinobacterium lividum]
MRYLLPLLALLLAGCGSRDPARHPSAGAAVAPDSTLSAMDPVPTNWQPEAFLDSVGRLPIAPLMADATQYADSVFTHQPMQGRVFSAADIHLLKQAQVTGFLKIQVARRILGDTSISSRSNEAVVDDSVVAQGLVRVRYLPFGADEYGLDVGVSGHQGSAMYFFKGNRLIARHETPYIYGQSLKYYRDAEGHAVVYYIYGFLRGSGNWWNQYFFYRYEGNRLVPVLSELQNGNQTGFGCMGARDYWLEATVQQINPLTLKMVYHVEMPDTADTAPRLLDDSTLVVYRWNQQAGRLEGQYQRSKITYPQVLSYYASDTDLLFINTHYARLKQALADSVQRPATRRYLWAMGQH